MDLTVFKEAHEKMYLRVHFFIAVAKSVAFHNCDLRLPCRTANAVFFNVYKEFGWISKKRSVWYWHIRDKSKKNNQGKEFNCRTHDIDEAIRIIQSWLLNHQWRSPKAYLAFYIAINCGLRLGEIRALTVADVTPSYMPCATRTV